MYYKLHEQNPVEEYNAAVCYDYYSFEFFVTGIRNVCTVGNDAILSMIAFVYCDT